MTARVDPARAVSDAALVLGRVEGVLEGAAAFGTTLDHQKIAIRKTLAELKAQADPVIWAAISCALAHPGEFRIHLEAQFAARQGSRPGFVDL
jgi:hypothetical protein